MSMVCVNMVFEWQTAVESTAPRNGMEEDVVVIILEMSGLPEPEALLLKLSPAKPNNTGQP